MCDRVSVRAREVATLRPAPWRSLVTGRPDPRRQARTPAGPPGTGQVHRRARGSPRQAPPQVLPARGPAGGQLLEPQEGASRRGGAYAARGQHRSHQRARLRAAPGRGHVLSRQQGPLDRRRGSQARVPRAAAQSALGGPRAGLRSRAAHRAPRVRVPGLPGQQGQGRRRSEQPGSAPGLPRVARGARRLQIHHRGQPVRPWRAPQLHRGHLRGVHLWRPRVPPSRPRSGHRQHRRRRIDRRGRGPDRRRSRARLQRVRRPLQPHRGQRHPPGGRRGVAERRL